MRLGFWGWVREWSGLIRLSHTVFALPFALIAAVLAVWGPGGRSVRARDWAGILVCMVTARAAAMGFNRWLDREMDAGNPRTAGRHLPRGVFSPAAVAWFVAGNAALFVGGTALFLPNRWPMALSLPVLAWLLGYSYAKRFTMWAHAWLGVALMLAPLATWIALRGDWDWAPFCLALVVLFWVTGFDIIYACQDYDYDTSVGLHSIPARMGVRRALRMAAVSHGLMLLALIAFGWVAGLGAIYAVGVGVIAGFLAIQHALVRPDDLSRVNVAFFQVNAVISIGLLLIVIADLAWS